MGDRHQFRADWHDYNGGIYFVTICSHDKRHIFGKISGGVFYPTELGELVKQHIQLIPQHHPDTTLLNYVVMPNHVHMVLSVGTRLIASLPTRTSSEPTQKPSVTSTVTNNPGCLRPPMHGEATADFHHNSRLAIIVGALKAGITRTARTRLIASLPCWQSRYHEHIIRNQRAFENIMSYIDNNVANWNRDCFYKTHNMIYGTITNEKP